MSPCSKIHVAAILNFKMAAIFNTDILPYILTSDQHRKLQMVTIPMFVMSRNTKITSWNWVVDHFTWGGHFGLIRPFWYPRWPRFCSISYFLSTSSATNIPKQQKHPGSSNNQITSVWRPLKFQYIAARHANHIILS